MKISAVIFDLNGTVLDDEDEYGMAFNKVLSSLGVDSKTKYPQEMGIGVKNNWPILLKKYNIKTDKSIEQLTNETQEAYINTISEISVRVGFDDFAERLKDSGIRIALATSNTWEIVDKVLEKTDLTNVFEELTTSDEVVYSKPDPDLFILTADKLSIPLEECLVIEDAKSGVEAAHRANMKVIAISRDQNYSDELKDADLVVEGFSEITPKVLEEI